MNLYNYYDYDYGYNYRYSDFSDKIFLMFMPYLIVSLLLGIFGIICLYKIFSKAGKPGWAAIIPIYNMIVLLEITELPMWYIALFFIPIGNIIALFLVYIELAHRFGKSTGFGVGMVFLSPIFLALLAFDSKAKYQNNKSYNTETNNFENNNNQQNVSFCPKCGYKVDSNQSYCKNCGSKIL